MRAGISITLSPVERRRLQALIRGPQRCAEARLASPDRVADGRGARHQREHAAERQV
jgi:hypothetical protein